MYTIYGNKQNNCNVCNYGYIDNQDDYHAPSYYLLL